MSIPLYLFRAIASIIDQTGFIFGLWGNCVLWSSMAGILAMLLYKVTSPQHLITDAKRHISAQLLTIRLYQHSPRWVMRATAQVLWHNTRYFCANLWPLLVLTPPMVAIMAGLVVRHAYRGLPAQKPVLIKIWSDDPEIIAQAELHIEHRASVYDADPSAHYPVTMEHSGRPLRSPAGFMVWQATFAGPGNYHFTLHHGSGAQAWSAYVDAQAPTWTRCTQDCTGRQSPMLTSEIDAFLYPAALPQGPPLAKRIEFQELNAASLGPFPAGEAGVVILFAVISLGVGLLVKGPLGVTI